MITSLGTSVPRGANKMSTVRNDESSSGKSSPSESHDRDGGAKYLRSAPNSPRRGRVPRTKLISQGREVLPVPSFRALSGEGSTEEDSSYKEKDVSDGGQAAIAVSTVWTSPTSHPGSRSGTTSPPKDWTYDEVGEEVDVVERSSLEHDSTALLRTAIGGIEREDFPGIYTEQKQPTVITDGGNQQFKGQWQSVSFSSASKSLISIEQRSLQRKIYKAAYRTTHPKAQAAGQGLGFLPKARIERLITPKSVVEELKRTAPGVRSEEGLLRLAEQVCQDVPVKLKDDRVELRSYKQIFAILVLVEMASKIEDFIDRVSDLDLPLVEIRDDTGWIEIGRPPIDGIPSEPLWCFSEWTLMNKSNFLQYQWMMLAPFFRESEYNDVQHYPLRDHHILPLMTRPLEHDCDEELPEPCGGGFGEVFMAHIHPEHHNFSDHLACKRGFAIKQLHGRNPKYFQREVSILQKFVGVNAHEHIVSLLATYELRGKYHMIFYRAQGDLFNYWKELNPSPTFTYDTVQWMAKQCQGICDGLAQLHKHLTLSLTQPGNPHDERTSKYPVPGLTATQKEPRIITETFQLAGHKRKRDMEAPGISMYQEGSEKQIVLLGRHGDLKPENILWFRGNEGSAGTLKITDFGQADLHDWILNTHKRSQIADTMTYRAPECDLERNKSRQSSDIWSLGCVFLEFVAWMLGGSKLLNEFAESRLATDVFHHPVIKTDTFFEIAFAEGSDQHGVAVKPVVTKFIRDLHSHQKCSDFVHDFLNLIEDKMLIIEEVHEAKMTRSTSSQIQKLLQNMYEKCLKDKDYAKRPTPKQKVVDSPEKFHPKLVRLPVADEAVKIITRYKELLPVYGSTEDETQREAYCPELEQTKLSVFLRIGMAR
ncbi:Cyclin-dependent kinase E-1 [Paramyrothecium foliicola]|nr:Cyclin-dependent kinase E-1 [Paramyrothecium foliicola]